MSAITADSPDIHGAYVHDDGAVSLIVQYARENLASIVTLSGDDDSVTLTHESGHSFRICAERHARASIAGAFTADPESWARRFFGQ